MKKLLLSFLSFFACCLALMAQTKITWSGQSDWTGIGTTDISYTSGNYTISASKVTGCQTNPTVNAKANDFRCYANGITLVGNSTENIKKIVFHLSTQGIARWTDLTPSEGAVTNDTDNGLIVWEGDAQYVQFTVGAKAVYGPDVTQAGQFCFSSVTAYTAADLESGGGESGGGEGGEGEGGETPNPDEDITLYSETFGTNQGAFTIDDKVLPEGTTYIWSFASGYGMKASAYVNKTNYASESWLVSPKFDCTNATALTLSFSEAANFFKSAENVSAYTSVKVKEVGTDTWTDLTLSARASGTNWTFADGITADLSAYVGKKMQIAFVYTSSAELAGTWEVKNFELKGKGEVTVESEVVIPEYTKIAELKNNATATATAVKFTFTDLLVTGTAGTSTYVTDGTDGLLLYGTASPYKAGDKISGTIAANLFSYNNLTELKDLDLTGVTVTSEGNVVTPVAATINELVANQKKYENVLVKLSEVSFGSDALDSKNNISLSDGEESITLRDNFGVLTDFIFDTTKQYNVTAVATIFNESIQLYALSADDIQMITNLVDPETAWAADTVAVMPGQEEYECALGTNYEGTITYSSSDETVATIDANGDITFVGYGHTVITAETPETSEYLASKASFDLFFIEGEGTLAKPYTPADVQYFSGKVEGKAWVKGEISGFFNNNAFVAGTEGAIASNLALSAGDINVPVALPSGQVRTDLNLLDNATNLGKTVWVYGTIEKYFKVPGVKNVTDYSWDGEGTLTGIDSLEAAPANTKADVIYSIDGRRLAAPAKGFNIINGKKVIR